MAGLGVLLENKEKISRYTHILSKTSLKNSLSSVTAISSTCAYASSFLEHCNLCRRKLQQGKDIYMYRGDRAFCSEECRCRQIFMDEESMVKDHCSLVTATTAAERKHPAGHRPGRATARGHALAGLNKMDSCEMFCFDRNAP